MIPVDDYLRHIVSLVKPLSPTMLGVYDALGCVLARDLPALVSVPPFTNSAMDGYAMRVADIPEKTCADAPFSLRVVGDIPAGDSRHLTCEPGTAWRIMTGAALPDGADCVVKVEDTDQPSGNAPLPKAVTIFTSPSLHHNIRQAGEDVTEGHIVLQSGIPLTAAALSSATSIGYSQLPVYPQPRIAIISTGTELVTAGKALRHGQIPDSNSVLLHNLAISNHCKVTAVHRCNDSTEEFYHTLIKVAQNADIIITTGGISAGAYDVVKAFGMKSDMYFTRVAMQPGKPQGCGVMTNSRGDSVLVATLPGNPVSVFVSFFAFVRPVLYRLTHRSPNSVLPPIAATFTSSWTSRAGKRQFVPVHVTDPLRPGETPMATPTHHLGSTSHLVASLHLANGLAVIPEDVEEIPQWGIVDVLRLGTDMCS
ncbi:MAG: molybdopterin molybdotransferase MoeA [Actinomycetaceae bacterium]|nr:molybdopterin molybdotransferase MoeA [Actinomycetaceae bacterium]